MFRSRALKRDYTEMCSACKSIIKHEEFYDIFKLIKFLVWNNHDRTIVQSAAIGAQMCFNIQQWPYLVKQT